MQAMRGLILGLCVLLLAHCEESSPSREAEQDNSAALLTSAQSEFFVPELEFIRQSSSSITVVTWNLEWFPGRAPASTDAEKLVHMTQAQETLAQLSPDVLCLQEVRAEAAVKELLSALPDHTLHVYTKFQGAQQVAISSRLKATSAFAQKFEAGGEKSPPRGFAYAALDTAEGPLLVYGVHLKSNRGGIEENIPVREESARQLVAHVKAMQEQMSNAGVVIAGDFNTDSTENFGKERTIQILESPGLSWCWSDVPHRKRITWPSGGNYPDACFDHVYLSGVKLHQVKTVTHTERTSDHRAVMVEIGQRQN